MNFTKSIPALIFLVTACVIFSCRGQSGTKNMVADAGNANPTASDASAPNATFSYNLDGTKVSGGEVDEILLNNAVYITKSENNTEKFSFFLSDAYKSNTETFAHSLRFAIPNKPGTTTLTPMKTIGMSNYSYLPGKIPNMSCIVMTRSP